MKSVTGLDGAALHDGRGAIGYGLVRVTVALAAVLGLLGAALPSQAEAQGTLFPFGLSDVGSFASPDLVDIDADGDLDCFVGNRIGKTVFFENIGGATNPVFAEPVTDPFGLKDVGLDAQPEFADIDGDGDLDAFIGASNGNTLFFRNDGTASLPEFVAPPKNTTNPFGITDVGSDAGPEFADIDGDGLLDVFVGAGTGVTFFFRNDGTPTVPQFIAAVPNPFNLKTGTTVSVPALADRDADGDLDMFIGKNNGNTLFFQNTGSATDPFFAAPLTNPFGIQGTPFQASPALADIDRNGTLDALIGNDDADLFLFKNVGVAAPGKCVGTGANVLRARVRDAQALPIADIKVKVAGPGGCKDTGFTNASGIATFPNLANGNYKVKPKSPFCTFDPPSRSVTLSGGAVKAKFVATCP